MVLGILILFGLMALTGVMLLLIGREGGIIYPAIGAFILPVSVAIIWKTTRSYLKKPAVVAEEEA